MSKISVIYLHVGADKAGSTSIQRFFDNNRQLLKQFGYCYPPLESSSLDDISSSYSHYLVATFFSHNLPGLDYYRVRTSVYDEIEERGKAKDYLEFVSQELQGGDFKALILSYEGFTGLDLDELEEFKSYLLSIANEIRVVYYLRPRFSYGLSALSQRIRLGLPAWKHHPPVNYYRPHLLDLESVFGKQNMIVSRFSRSDFRDGDFISDFCFKVGLDGKFVKDAIHSPPSNESLSELAIRVGDALVFLLSCVDGPKGIEFNKLFSHDLESLNGRSYSFNDLQNEVILEATKEDSLYIRTNYGIELIDAPKESCNKCPTISNEAAEFVARLLIKSKLPNLKLSDEKYDPIDGQRVRKALGNLRVLSYESSLCGLERLLSVTVRVKNNSHFFWGGDVLPVNVSYRWYDVNGKELDIDSIRTPLPGRGIAKGETKDVVVSVLLPKTDGEYRLELTMVQEYCAWFDDIGFKPQVIDIKLVGGEPVNVSPEN